MKKNGQLTFTNILYLEALKTNDSHVL